MLTIMSPYLRLHARGLTALAVARIGSNVGAITLASCTWTRCARLGSLTLGYRNNDIRVTLNTHGFAALVVARVRLYQDNIGDFGSHADVM